MIIKDKDITLATLERVFTRKLVGTSYESGKNPNQEFRVRQKLGTQLSQNETLNAQTRALVDILGQILKSAQMLDLSTIVSDKNLFLLTADFWGIAKLAITIERG